MTVVLHWERGGLGVVCRCSGVVTGQEIIDWNRDVLANRNFYKMRYQLVDFLAAEDLVITPTEIRKLSLIDEQAAKTNPLVRVAMVAFKGQLEGRLAIFDHYVEHSRWEARMFHDRASADEWLQSSREIGGS